MAAIKGKDTQPEIAVRSILDAMRVRYQLHRPDLPGKPDMVFSRRKKAIFVHGCFWHLHCCRYGRVKPATNARFWRDKRNETRRRDQRNRCALRKAGWEVSTVWECWIKRPRQLIARLTKFLGSRSAKH
jgi:DNA mismatch endonuclease (patch repair protein)